MLKKISGLFLGLIVLAGSACVTPTHASSAPSVIITSIEAATQTGAKNELVTLYNATDNTLDVTGWCLTNKSAIRFACFYYEGFMHGFLLPHGYATVTSESYVADVGAVRDSFSLVYTVANQSSGSIVNGSDTISLVDADNQIIDTKTWSSAIPSGRALVRLKLFSQPDTYAMTGNASDWLYDARQLLPENGMQSYDVIPQSIEDPELETGTLPDVPGHTGEDATPLLPLRITELLPDATGSDINNEFVELFNPNSQSVPLANYRLLVGASFEKSYQFPAGLVVGPGGYLAVYNNVVKYSLNNTAGGAALSLDGKLTDGGISYSLPHEGEAWAFFENGWSYTNQPTPGQPNLVSAVDDIENDSQIAVATTLKPCAANQYRSLETGRCRLLMTSTQKVPAPCEEGQVRSPETNRCRLTTDVAAKVACKEGQSRSPDTGRCRTVKVMPKVGYGLKEAKVTQKSSGVSWYMWVAIGGVIAIIVGYGVWEWRTELQVAWERISSHFRKPAR